MNNAHVRRHNFEIVESRLSPAQKDVALAVALELQKSVGVKSIAAGKFIHLHRMVNYKFGGLQRIDQLWIATHLVHGIAHCGEVHHRWNPSEVLHQYAGGRKCNLFVGNGAGLPLGQEANIFASDTAAIFRAQQVFQKDSERIWEALNRRALSSNSIQAVNLVSLVSDDKF